jgi:large subunit ribosomal protein L10
MNREQKAAVIEEITVEIKESAAVFAVDYRGISVAQAAELRGKLREVELPDQLRTRIMASLVRIG